MGNGKLLFNSNPLKDMIEKFTQWFQEHPELSAIGTILSLLLGFWGILQAYKYRSLKRFSYSIQGYNLIKDYSEKINGLNIKFQGSSVKNLTVSRLVIWNSGNLTIDRTDIVEKDRLRIKAFDGFSIFDSSIIQFNDPSNNLCLKQLSPSELEINFDYLDKSDGCVIQIIHDGTKSSVINLKGKIKGISKLKEIENDYSYLQAPDDPEYTKAKNIGKKFKNILPIGVLYILITLIYNLYSGAEYPFFIWIMIFLFIPYLYVVALRIFRPKVPNGLNAFNEEL
ncbi:hypothetical protein GCM10027275_11950 [Rhabdobacter roseus]